MTEDQRYYFEERAAIYEFEAGLDRPESERRAASDLGMTPPPVRKEEQFELRM